MDDSNDEIESELRHKNVMQKPSLDLFHGDWKI